MLELMEAAAAEFAPKLNGGQFTEGILNRVHSWLGNNIRAAILTLVNVEGSSPRPIGSQMAVNELGEYVGLLSGGCVESALCLEAIECINKNTPKVIRYGKGSRYFDIQLPCGSGIDILIQPVTVQSGWIQKAHECVSNRQPCLWSYYWPDKNKIARLDASANRLDNGSLNIIASLGACAQFAKVYWPRMRIVVVGDGVIFDYFCRFAHILDCEVIAFSSRGNAGQIAVTQGVNGDEEPTWNKSLLDPWTSLVLITHDHEREWSYLEDASHSSVGFVCALGSRKTHQRRIDFLKERGISESFIQAIKSPAGLNIGSQSPPEIALSMVSEVVAMKNQINKSQ